MPNADNDMRADGGVTSKVIELETGRCRAFDRLQRNKYRKGIGGLQVNIGGYITRIIEIRKKNSK